MFKCGAKCNNYDKKKLPITFCGKYPNLEHAICLIKKNNSHLLLLLYPFLVSWFQGIGEVKISVCLLLALLAASASTLKARSSCTAVVCSCYAPNSIRFNNKGGERSKTTTIFRSQNRDELQQYGSSGNGSNGISLEFPNLKSNLKKKTKEDQEINCSIETRKVNWPDAHGKDIAHIQEFEPSVSGDGELEGVRNSCVCTIQ